jgi:hypothetical protein
MRNTFARVDRQIEDEDDARTRTIWLRLRHAATFCEILAQLEKVFDPPQQIVLMNLDLLESGSLEPGNKFLHPGDVMTKVFHHFRPTFDDWLQIFGLEL